MSSNPEVFLKKNYESIWKMNFFFAQNIFILMFCLWQVGLGALNVSVEQLILEGIGNHQRRTVKASSVEKMALQKTDVVIICYKITMVWGRCHCLASICSSVAFQPQKWNEEMCFQRCLSLKYLLTTHPLEFHSVAFEMRGSAFLVDILLHWPVPDEAAESVLSGQRRGDIFKATLSEGFKNKNTKNQPYAAC